MATKKSDAVALESVSPDAPKPRLVKLIVKNYRCIGPNPVEIELDDIVVLVGANNVGKSTLLQAYETAMNQGSKEGKLTLDDFPNNTIDPLNLPTIELHTIIYDAPIGDEWVEKLPNEEKLIKERWVWQNEGEPKRQGWSVETKDWSDKVPWGAPSVANARRPEPHRVKAFESPQKQTEQITSLLKQELDDRIKNMRENGDGKDDYSVLLNQVRNLQKKIVEDSQQQIDVVNSELTTMVSKVFPGYKIDFDARPENDLDNSINWFKSNPQLLMGPSNNGHLSSIERQGSGAQRTLLWTALKYISESGKKKGMLSGRPHLLLIDEPEMCLHPSAIRDASDALYGLPQSGNWQVMITSHSPIFIDLSKDNTTVVRVDKDSNGEVRGTTVFRPEKAQLDDDDKQNLKLLNICDPYVAEFFFGGRIVVVEGDTEYTAFNYIKSLYPDDYRDVHIIRARGKATIASVVKILNHFGTNYSVLHDSDRPLCQDGIKKNPAWTNNQRILDTIAQKPVNAATKLVASIPNFEEAYFGVSASDEKPYRALKKLIEDDKILAVIKQLFDSLLDHSRDLPENCLEWKKLNELEERLHEHNNL